MNFFRDGAFHLIIQLTAVILPCLGLSLVTRILPAEEFGKFELYLALTSFLVPILASGFDQILSNNYFKTTTLEKRQLIGNYLGFVASVFVVSTLVLKYFSSSLAKLIDLPSSALVSMSGYASLVSLVLLGQSFALLQNRVGLHGIFLISKSGIAYLFAVPLLIFWPVWDVLLITNFLVLFLLSALTMLVASNMGILSINVSQRTIYSICLSGGKLGILGLLLQLIGSNDRPIIQFFLGVDFVGYYSIPCRIMGACTMLLIACYRPAAPWIIKQLTCTVRPQRRVVALIYLYWALIILSFGFAGYFGNYFVQLIAGPAYQAGEHIIPLLAISSMLNTLYIFNFSLIMLRKEADTILIAAILVFVQNVLMNSILIPNFGLYGAATTSIVSYGILMIISFSLILQISDLPWWSVANYLRKVIIYFYFKLYKKNH